MKAVDLIKKIQSEVETGSPSRAQMLDDIKMMGFKIRPVVGDLALLADKANGFIEALWKIGKMEEIVGNNLKKLNPNEKELLFRYLERKQQRLQTLFGQADHSVLLEIEVVRETRRRQSLIH